LGAGVRTVAGGATSVVAATSMEVLAETPVDVPQLDEPGQALETAEGTVVERRAAVDCSSANPGRLNENEDEIVAHNVAGIIESCVVHGGTGAMRGFGCSSVSRSNPAR
jgi:hypothetical protein